MKKLADGRGLAKVPALTRQIADGEVDLSDWDDEELLRGRRRDKNGGWTGPRAPKLVPLALHRELVQRRMQKAHALLGYSLVDAVKLLTTIVNDEQAARRTRIRAAEIVLDRVLGRPKEQIAVDLSADDAPAWQRLIAEAIVGSVEQIKESQTDDVIEGEVVEEPAKAKPRKNAR